MKVKKLDSQNYYPTDLDLAKALTLARHEHCLVQIDCKNCLFNVDENMNLECCKRQVEHLIYGQ